MSKDIKHYRTILENAYSGAGNDDPEHLDPATAAQLVRHAFSNADKATIKAALLGHKNDPDWALSVLDHLSK